MPKIISLSGDVGYEITARSLKRQFPSDNSEVLLSVNSPGGNVSDGIELYNAIKDYSGPISARIDGMAASAASYFIMAADKVIVRKNSIFMAHKAWSFMIGDADNMQTEANLLNGIDNVLAEEYSVKFKKKKGEILKEMKNEIWLIGGDNIIAYGAADEQMEDDNNNDSLDFKVIESKARIAVNATKQKMKDANDSKEEFNRISALIHIKNQASLVEPDNKIKEEAEIMNEAELKSKFPDLYNSIINQGVKQESDRVCAFMVYNDIDPEGVKKAIESGESLNQKQLAEFSRKAMNKTVLNDIEGDSAGDIETETPKKPDGQSEEVKALNEKLNLKYGGKK